MPRLEPIYSRQLNLMTPMLRRRSFLLSLALACACLCFAPAASGQDRPDVAVVDVDRILAESALVKSIEEQARIYGQQVQARLQQLQQEGQQLTAQLQQLNPATDKARELRQQVILKNAEGEGINAAAQRELALISASGRLRMLNAMKEAVAQVAQERQLRLVMQKAPPLPAALPASYEPGNAQRERQFQELIDRQVALYSAPEIDITGEVLVRMDATFRAGGGQAPATRPATGGAPPPQ